MAAETPQGIAHRFEQFPGNYSVRQEAWYSGIAPIGQLRYSFEKTIHPGPDALWEDRAYVLNKDFGYTVLQGGTNHNNVSAVNQVINVTDDGSRFALFVNAYTGTFSGNSPQVKRWYNILVVGRHGLPTQILELRYKC